MKNRIYGFIIAKTLILIGSLCVGFVVGLFWLSLKADLDTRHTSEYLNLLRCCEERYEYCPYCGHALSYKYTNPINTEATQELLLELSEESDISIDNTNTSSQP